MPETEYRATGYTDWLTEHTPVWRWGAFEFERFSVFAPVGTLGEPRDFIARHIAEIIEQEGSK